MTSKPHNTKTSDELLLNISGKLDTLIAIIAVQGKNSNKQVKMLTNLGLSSERIGALLGIHPVNVRKMRGAKKR